MHGGFPWTDRPAIESRTSEEAGQVACASGDASAARGGDWDASALNHAVFRGNAVLTRFLLEHGAQWTEEHGFGDNASGSLSWASCNEPEEGGDWAACAQALLDHGMPHAIPDRDDPEWLLIAGRKKPFSDEVRDVLLGDAA